MRYLITGILLTAAVVTSFLGSYQADMRLDPLEGWTELNEVFVVNVLVEANTPVNVFQGDLTFDPEYLTVDSIDYNNSVADLWTTEPWYSNGAGTINFAGGTTQLGGFIGEDSLMQIAFRTKKVGNSRVRFTDVKILQHDGMGSDAIIAESFDAVFAVIDSSNAVITDKSGNKAKLYVLPNTTPTDLNGDGEQTLADLSIFMGDLAGGNLRSDFNRDGKTTLADLSILLQAD